MANPVLFRSSVLMTLVHLAALLQWPMSYVYDRSLIQVYAIGLLLSLLNHGLTSNLVKWADRGWMALGCATDLTRILGIGGRGATTEAGLLLALQVTLISSFFLAKYLISLRQRVSQKLTGSTQPPGIHWQADAAHLVTHVGATGLHVWLIHRAAGLPRS